MTFPISPKDGEVFEHPNGYVYEFDEDISTWNKTEKLNFQRLRNNVGLVSVLQRHSKNLAQH